MKSEGGVIEKRRDFPDKILPSKRRRVAMARSSSLPAGMGRLEVPEGWGLGLRDLENPALPKSWQAF